MPQTGIPLEVEDELSMEERIKQAEEKINKAMGEPGEKAKELIEDDSIRVLKASEDATPEDLEIEATARAKVNDKLTAMEAERNRLEEAAESMLKESDALNDKIQELTLCKALADGAFSENSWALDVSKKDYFSIIWTTLDRHPMLAKLFAIRPTHPMIKFNGLVLQLTPKEKQMMLYAESDDSMLVEFVKANKMKVSLLTVAELAGQHKKMLNLFMRAVKDFESVADREAINTALAPTRTVDPVDKYSEEDLPDGL